MSGHQLVKTGGFFGSLFTLKGTKKVNNMHKSRGTEGLALTNDELEHGV